MVDRRSLIGMMRKKGDKRGTNKESGRSIEGNKKQSKSGREVGEGFSDGKKSEAGVPIKPFVIQYSISGYRKKDEKSKIRGSENRR